MSLNKEQKEDLEIAALTALVKDCYGYDFNDYSSASLKRRIRHLADKTGHLHISDMFSKVLYQPDFLESFLCNMSVSVTSMFRDPWVFKTLREAILPLLSIHPKINIWHAGCCTGEEVFSMAILLKEAGLLEHVQIYATDFNQHSLDIANKGMYPLEKIQAYTKNYIECGGQQSFSDYYHVKSDSALMDKSLREKIIFSSHNLVGDAVFAQMNLIVCRNTLIYFNRTLQNNVVSLFKQSLAPKGFLVLGDKESIEFLSVVNDFDVYARQEKIFRLK